MKQRFELSKPLKNLREMYVSFGAMVLLLLLSLVSTSCYHKKTPSNFRLSDSIQEAQISRRILPNHDSLDLMKQADNSIEWSGTTTKLDSFAFRVKHHYSEGFNFVVSKDSLMLLRQQPEEAVNNLETDSFAVAKGKSLVVAGIRILPNDSIDSVWVRVATEDYAFGWARERQLLKKVDPDTPISQFISLFSNTHLLIFLVVISLIGVSYLMRKIMKRNANIVHFNDINSFYPTLLAIIVATSATFYASIQLFAPETWREFYFHPSLNVADRHCCFRRCPPIASFGRCFYVSVRFGSYLCDKLYCFFGSHLILYRIPAAFGLHLLWYSGLVQEKQRCLRVWKLRLPSSQERTLPPLRCGKRIVFRLTFLSSIYRSP